MANVMKTEKIEKIQKITSKGQITLPIAWRKKMGVDTIVVRTNGETLEISPARLVNSDADGYTTVFDAIRDNGGKGIKAKDLAKLIAKIDK